MAGPETVQPIEGLRLRPIKTKAAGDGADGKATDSGEGSGSMSWHSDGAATSDEPVSPVGRLFLHDRFYTSVCCALEFEDVMSLECLRDVLQRTLVRHPRFHSTLEQKGSKMTWVPVDSVDMARHVVAAQLTEEETANPPTAVESFVARLSGAPRFDTSVPLWEAHLLHVKRPKSQSTCVFRIHHSLGDGVSLMSLLLACTRQTANPDLLPLLPGAAAKPTGRSSDARVASADVTPADSEQLPAGEAARGKQSDELLEGSAKQQHMPSADSSTTLDSLSSSMHLRPRNDSGGGGEGGEGRGAQTGGSGEEAREVGTRESSRGSFLQQVWMVLVVMFNTLRHIMSFFAVLLFKPDTDTPIKGGEGVEHLARVFAVSEDMALSDLSAVRRATHTTINDVMMAVITMGVERYLWHHMSGTALKTDGSAAASKHVGLPKRVQVTAVALVNLRRAPGLQDLKVMLERGDGKSQAPWGNLIGNLLLPLPIGPFQTGSSSSSGSGSNGGGDVGTATGSEEEFKWSQPPKAKLMAVKRMCDSKKLSVEAQWSYLNGRVVVATAGMDTAAMLLRRMLSQTTLSVSNMLGPMQQVSLAGHAITAITPTTVGHPHALCCHLQSYNGALKVVAVAAQQHVPDPNFLCACFVKSFDDLKRDVLGVDCAKQ